MAGDGTRRGDGTLTVGSGQSSLGLSNFADAGTTAFSAGSQTTITDIVDFFAAGHTLRLNGTTTWSAGTVQIQDAGHGRERRAAAGHRQRRGHGLRPAAGSSCGRCSGG